MILILMWQLLQVRLKRSGPLRPLAEQQQWLDAICAAEEVKKLEIQKEISIADSHTYAAERSAQICMANLIC
eukprot:SAG31_NODE_1858_length_7061_cov_60.221201_3_plen_72_part_00